MRALVGGMFVALSVSAMVFSVLAFSNKSGPRAERSIWLLGRLAGKEHYTELGWRYRNLSLACQLLAMAAAVAWVSLGA